MTHQQLANLEQIRSIVDKPDVAVKHTLDEARVEKSVAYLDSETAMQSLEADPYWPKWNSPWWQMLLLWEMGLAKSIPYRAVEKMLAKLNEHYIPSFPFREEDIPAGVDSVRNIMCHCGLGSMYQLLTACEIDVDQLVPWARNWFLKYQMVDGGLNCDEAAYIRDTPKSSVVSTVPPLEAILHCTNREFTDEEIQFLDRGAEYLMKKELFRSQTSGETIDGAWLKVCFPRFYHYDVLRGLSFLTAWAKKLQRQLPLTQVGETITYLDGEFIDGVAKIQRQPCLDSETRVRDTATGEWTKGRAKSYPLLDALSRPGVPSHFLTKSWNQTRSDLKWLIDHDLIH